MTTIEKTRSQFILSDVPLPSHSNLLSFSPVQIDHLTFSSNNSDQEIYRSLSSSFSFSKSSEISLDSKSFFLKSYGKKDMFSKEIKVEAKGLKSPVVNLEETLITVTATESVPSTPPVSAKGKTTLKNLFGSMDQEEEETSPSQPISPEVVKTNTTNLFDSSFDTFAAPPPASLIGKGNMTDFSFDAFNTPSKVVAPASGGFDAFAGFDQPTVAPTSNTSVFDAFGFDLTSTSLSPPPPPVKMFSATASLTCLEELLCLYKNSVMEKFQLTGSLQYQYHITSEDSLPVDPVDLQGTQFKSSFRLTETAKKFQEIQPLSPAITLLPPTISSSPHVTTFLATFPWEEASTSPRTVGIIKYLLSPSLSPSLRVELMRIKVTLTSMTSETEHAVHVAIQLMLNKNYPQYVYENLQVMCSFTAFNELTSDAQLKSRPVGQFTAANKIMTWRCGNQTASRQAVLQMEVILSLPLSYSLSSLPSSLPVIVKGMMSDVSLIPDCTWDIDEMKIVNGDDNSRTMKFQSIQKGERVGYKTKLEYRFL
jgi:hypothetical protein